MNSIEVGRVGVDPADLDRDPVVAEVSDAFEAYEAALVAGDLDAMDRAFWDDARTVRFGIADHQWSAEEVRAWRAQAAALPPGRTLSETRVTAFGADLAVVTTRFRYPGRAMVGRQSQTWLRTDQGWRIVSAHVSEVPETD